MAYRFHVNVFSFVSVFVARWTLRNLLPLFLISTSTARSVGYYLSSPHSKIECFSARSRSRCLHYNINVGLIGSTRLSSLRSSISKIKASGCGGFT